MTVKDRVGRNRYLGFLLESRDRVSREELGRALAEAARALGGGLSFQLTVYDGARGILRVPHRQKGEALQLLGFVREAGREHRPVRFRPVITSGTIRKVKQRLGIPPSPPTRHGRRTIPQGKGTEKGRNVPRPR